MESLLLSLPSSKKVKVTRWSFNGVVQDFNKKVIAVADIELYDQVYLAGEGLNLPTSSKFYCVVNVCKEDEFGNIDIECLVEPKMNLPIKVHKNLYERSRTEPEASVYIPDDIAVYGQKVAITSYYKKNVVRPVTCACCGSLIGEPSRLVLRIEPKGTQIFRFMSQQRPIKYTDVSVHLNPDFCNPGFRLLTKAKLEYYRNKHGK